MQASILPYKMLNHLRNYTNTKTLVYIFLCPCLQHVLHNGQKYLLFLSLRNPAFQFCLSFICHLPLFLETGTTFPFLALHYTSTTDPHNQIYIFTVQSSFPMEIPLSFQSLPPTLFQMAFLNLLNKI